MDVNDHGPELGASLQRALQICEQVSELASELRKLISQRPAPVRVRTHDGSVVGVIGPHVCEDDPPSKPVA